MVDTYNQNCGYTIPKLKSHIIVFDDSILKYIKVDNGFDEASILTPPTILTGFSINYNEQTSLDERYKFTKTLNLSVYDKVDVKTLFNGKYYAIVEDLDGNYYLVNPDFKLRYTYTYHLSEGVNQTDITLVTDSNFPLLIINIPRVSINACKQFKYVHIKQLQMIESERAKWSNYNNQLTITDVLKNVDFNKNTLSFQEQFDGERVTATLSFNLPLHSADESWPYNLLEFKNNRYTAIITTSDGEKILTGIYNGLQPNYVINGSDNNTSNTYEINLVEMSNNSSIAVQMTIEELLGYKWDYIQQLDGNQTWHCNASVMGFGWAEIWVMAEVDNFGNQTGRYKILEDIYNGLYVQDDPDVDYSYYVDNYGWIRKYNVIGTFDTHFPLNWFPTSECAAKDEEEKCIAITDFQTKYALTTGYTYTFNLNASCDWEIDNIENLSISPTTGEANTDYVITIEPDDIGDASFALNCCTSSFNYGFSVDDGNCITPLVENVNCLEHTVIFTVQDGCKISNVQTDLPYKILDNGNLQVNVPATDETTGETYSITLDCCDKEVTIQIIQSGVYTYWGCMDDDCGYICENGNKYAREYLYTGVTSAEWHKTDTYRKGSLIESDSKDCQSLRRFTYFGNNICIDGDEYKLMQEEVSYDDGESWILTGIVGLGDYVDPEDEDYKDVCSETPAYKWVLTDDSVCVDE